ncbi:MAG: NAD(P)H-dependent oxidoreductase subunit E [Acidobacteria bacterium]|nr:NAD(P)H-dependent oxidoreductase subunit E [Acidobacteriota bacterium]MBI3655455.1 NAD(P)H-dependent oxidoreductase subunit E [Acidobacteriota bacterium]
MSTENVSAIVEKHSGARGALIAILQDIQSRYGYLPADALKIVAGQTGRTLVDIYGVATFYRAFRLKPRGKHLCSVCLGTACHVRGGPIIAEEFGRVLGSRAGETTADLEFTLETVNCLGACALGPIVVVDGHYFSNVSPVKVKEIVDQARAGLDRVEIKSDQRIFPVEVSCPRCNHGLMDTGHLVDGYPSIRATLSFGREHGWLRLSSLYGSFNLESEYEIPLDTVVNFFCPHCHAELSGALSCPECAAPMVPMIVRGGGIVQICSRRGCKGHLLDLSGIQF